MNIIDFVEYVTTLVLVFIHDTAAFLDSKY